MMGVADWLLDSYAEGIDATVNLLGNQLGWSPPPRRPKTNRVPVLVFDIGSHNYSNMPFTYYYYDEGYRSFIALQSELWETTVEAAKERARINGSHEAAHLYTHVHKQIDNAEYDDWAWFDEATAVYVEGVLNEHSSERHRFARDWVLRPERGLERRPPGVGYESAWFVEHLVRQHGWKILHDVWHDQKAGETPIQAIDRWFLNQDMSFRDASHAVADEFGRGYCASSFLTKTVLPCLHERFGNRWHCFSFQPARGKKESPHEGVIEPMACSYCKIVPESKKSGFRVKVLAASPLEQSGLKAHVFAVRDQVMLESPQALIPRRSSRSATALSKTIAPVAGADYYILALANVLSRMDHVGNPSPRLADNEGAMPNTTAYQVDVSA